MRPALPDFVLTHEHGYDEATPLWRIKARARKERRRRRVLSFKILLICAVYVCFIVAARPWHPQYAFIASALFLPFGMAAMYLAIFVCAVMWSIFMGEARDALKRFPDRLGRIARPVFRYYDDCPQAFCVAGVVALIFLSSITVRFGTKPVPCGEYQSLSTYYDRWTDSGLTRMLADICPPGDPGDP